MEKFLTSKENTGPEIYIAVYDYQARTQAELSFKIGDHLALLDEHEFNGWINARLFDQRRTVGLIPYNYVVPDRWFSYDITGKAAESMLREISTYPGSFIIRRSGSGRGEFALSVNVPGSVKHFHIQRNEEIKYFVFRNKASFNSITDLILYYADNYDERMFTKLLLPFPNYEETEDMWKINRERIVLRGILGEGKFGAVHKGMIDERTIVAVKVMKQETMDGQKFLDEAKIMKNLSHPNVVKLLAVVYEEPIYIVTEFVSYGSLKKYLKQFMEPEGGIPEFIKMAQQVASGMDYLEKMKYVHRDLRADNVLVGEDLICKVADFGMARLIKEEIYEANPSTKFPVRWTAPDVLANRNCTIKSDVWSFGILMVEIFTRGNTPYKDFEKNQMVVEQLSVGYRHPCPTSCPPTVYEIMLKCWKENPEERPTFEYLKHYFEDFDIAEEQYYVNYE